MSLPGSHSPSVEYSSPYPVSNSGSKSKPAQKLRPMPRKTITLIALSRLAVSTAAAISSGIGGTIVFRRSGLLSEIVAIASSVEYKMV